MMSHAKWSACKLLVDYAVGYFILLIFFFSFSPFTLQACSVSSRFDLGEGYEPEGYVVASDGSIVVVNKAVRLVMCRPLLHNWIILFQHAASRRAMLFPVSIFKIIWIFV